MFHRLSATESLLAAWIAGLSSTISVNWLLSEASALQFSGVAGIFLWMGVACWLCWTSQSWTSGEIRDLCSGLRFPPFLILGAMILVSALLYLPATHDSLSYRIPRMFLWLQEGVVGYVPASDERINYMTHNWELASLPILQLLGSRFLPTVSVISWIALYLLGRNWAGIMGFRGSMGNWVGLLPALCTFSALQARSTVNDLFAATLILTSAWFAFAFHRSPDSRKLVLSALALTLACGTKPHYIVLGGPWILWFVSDRTAPWRFVPWRHLSWLLPMALFVSPLPAFLINTVETGTFKGVDTAGDLSGGNPLLNIILGSLSFAWQSLQPPLNPLAGVWNHLIQGSALLESAVGKVPRFGLNVSYAQIVDSASVGFFVMIPCLLGWLFSFRLKASSEFRWIALAGILGFLLAVSQVVPGSIGRSFMGFMFLLLPLAMVGLSQFSDKANRRMIIAALLGAIVSIAFDASRPLFPARHFMTAMEATGLTPKAGIPLLENFLAFRERADAGVSLYHQIPPNSRVVVISGGGDPLVALWTQSHPASVHLAPLQANLEWVRGLKPDAIVVTGTGPEQHAGLIDEIAKNYRRAGTDLYLVRLQRGREKWELFTP